MAALIDLEVSDPQLQHGSDLSQDTLETMTLLCEVALGVSDITSDVCGAGGESAIRSRSPKAFLSESSTPLSQLGTPNAASGFATALTTRTSDAVIADLKSGPEKKRPTLTPVNAESSKRPAPDASSISATGQHGGNYEEVEENESEPEEIFVPSKPRKISERKRIQNAAMDNWIQNYQKQQARTAATANDVGSESYSVKYLVRQSESQKIISTPREYQVELFERAKEDNIIAVLDTGKSTYVPIKLDG